MAYFRAFPEVDNKFGNSIQKVFSDSGIDVGR